MKLCCKQNSIKADEIQIIKVDEYIQKLRKSPSKKIFGHSGDKKRKQLWLFNNLGLRKISWTDNLITPKTCS